MRRSLLASIAALCLLMPALPAMAQSAPACRFVLGFAALHALDPVDTGSCLDDQAFAANGDARQHTTTGLMAWRKADNWTAFTNGYWTWINGPDGLAKRLNTQRFGWEANPDGLPEPAPTLSPAGARLAPLALQLEDLPAGFAVQSEQEYTPEMAAATDANPAAALQDFQRRGRLDSIIVTYQKQASFASFLTGPVYIRDQIIDYRDQAGALTGLGALNEQYKSSGFQAISVGNIGDRAIAFQQLTTSDGYHVIYFKIVVLTGNFAIILDIGGSEGAISADDAIPIAQAAVKRVARVA